MILIHTALLCEAQAFIEKYKLKKLNNKIYKNNNIIILISGIGKENIISTLDYMFLNYTIKKAFNIGIAGVNNKNVNIGSLFCTNHHLKNVNNLPLITVNTPQIQNKEESNTILYDMEAKYFEEISSKYLSKNDIYVFKVVSDYLSSEILKKDYIKSLIKNKLKKIKPFIKSN